MDISKLRGMVYVIATDLHTRWAENARGSGFHTPDDCPERGEGPQDKFLEHCAKCKAPLYPFNELPNTGKFDVLKTVEEVLNSIERIEQDGC